VYNSIEEFMPTIGWWQNCQSQSKILDPPNEYIISKITSGWEYQRALVSITLRLLSATDEIQKDQNRLAPRLKGIKQNIENYWLIDKA